MNDGKPDAYAGHTPGPWLHREGNGQYMFEVFRRKPSGKEHVVARIASGAQWRESDARLIAAAPDLLAENTALREIERLAMEAVRTHEAWDQNPPLGHWSVANAAWEALAMAIRDRPQP